MFAEAKSQREKGRHTCLGLKTHFFSFGFSKLKLLERNNSPEGNVTVQPMKYTKVSRTSAVCISPVPAPRPAPCPPLACSMPVIVEKHVSCKSDLDIMPRSYSMPRIRKVLLFPLLLADKNKSQTFLVILCF